MEVCSFDIAHVRMHDIGGVVFFGIYGVSFRVSDIQLFPGDYRNLGFHARESIISRMI